MPDHGLSQPQLLIIQDILRPFASEISKVALFGSRAKETHRPNSDIDLVLYGTIDEKTVDRIWTLFDESSLPFKVDVKAHHLINYAPLKKHIDDVNIPLFTQDDLNASSTQS